MTQSIVPVNINHCTSARLTANWNSLFIFLRKADERNADITDLEISLSHLDPTVVVLRMEMEFAIALSHRIINDAESHGKLSSFFQVHPSAQSPMWI